MKKVITILILSLTVSAQLWANNIAVFNIQDVVDSIDEGKKAKSAMETSMSDAQKKQKEFTELQTKFGKLQEEFGKMRLAWDKKVLEQKQNALIAMQKDLQSKAVELQKLDNELRKKELQYQAVIGKKIQEVIKKIASTGSYDLILEKLESGVHFSKPKMDITDLVIKEYNKVHKK
ncbi:OmpH family outer membrane protein [bacterium]|nr:OmpH family outer membrane protein [bacterium]